MATVRLENVRKVYEGNVTAVHDASFTVEDGEFVVLVGPSGCGKSTMLRMVAGLEVITAGRLYIDEQLVNDVAPKDRDIAMVFQNYALYPHMSVYDNMAFGLKLRKYPKTEIDQRVRNAADILGISSILERKPKQLSGGQRQRVAVGRAIVRQPKVFLFDEPLSNLDAKLRVQMRTEISRLHHRLNATMVYVTHDQVEAMTMGDRIVVLRDGWIQQIDSPLNLYNKPANKFVGGFIGSPAMNFISGSIIRQDGLTFRSSDGSFSLALIDDRLSMLQDYAGRDVDLGIRPEDIYVADARKVEGPVAKAKMILDVVEPMGNEIVIYASTSVHSVVGRVAPQRLPETGETVELAFDLSKTHFFNGDTEESILSPLMAATAA